MVEWLYNEVERVEKLELQRYVGQSSEELLEDHKRKHSQ